MKGFLYILLCAEGSFYTGSTNDLERRLEEHQKGEGANYTRKRLPVELVYTRLSAKRFKTAQRLFYAFTQNYTPNLFLRICSALVKLFFTT